MMRQLVRTLAVTSVVGAIALVAVDTAAAQVDLDCVDFVWQEDAQAFFLAAGPGDPHRLDADSDGIACETLPRRGGGGTPPPSQPPAPGQPPAPPPGATLGDGPGATSAETGQIDVVVRGQDDVPYIKHFNGTSWGAFASLGGIVTGTPAIASRAPGTLDVFIRGQDDALWTRWFNGSTWSGWVSLGGSLSTPPAVVSRSPGTLDVFAGGADGSLYTRRLGASGWSDWGHLGGLLSAAPSAASPTPGNITVFIRGQDERGVGDQLLGWRVGRMGAARRHHHECA